MTYKNQNGRETHAVMHEEKNKCSKGDSKYLKAQLEKHDNAIVHSFQNGQRNLRGICLFDEDSYLGATN